MAEIEICRAGPATSVQDLGRVGFQELGVCQTGAADKRMLKIANALVGNDENAACLEFSLVGPKIRVVADGVLISVAGEVSVKHNGAEVAGFTSFICQMNDEVEIGSLKSHSYAYLAVRGGLNTPPLYGSRSTHARAGMGGHKGRNLIDGDLLPLVASNADVKPMYLPAKQVKSLLTKMFEVSVVMGPQDDAFSVAEIKRFLTSTYQVGRNTDRMGMRLQGPVLEHESSADILSDGIAPGSVQVPGSGLPIVLLAERQTIGGYTKIATVVSCELGRLSQLLSGAEFKFNKVSPEEAISMTRRKHKEMTELISSICVQPTSVILSDLMTNNLVSGVVDANSSCEK